MNSGDHERLKDGLRQLFASGRCGVAVCRRQRVRLPQHIGVSEVNLLYIYVD